MNSIRSSFLAAAATSLFLAGAASAQEATPDPATQESVVSDKKMLELNRQIKELGEELTKRSENYPAIIEEIRAKRADIDKAETSVKQMIADLTQLTDKMDQGSDFHAELQGLERQVESYYAEAQTMGDQLSADALEKLKKRMNDIKKVERDRADAVIAARAAIRTLEANQVRLVFVRKIAAIDEAIAIMQKSVSDFQGIVATATVVADTVSTAVAGQ